MYYGFYIFDGTIIFQVKIWEVDEHVQYTFHTTVRRLTLTISHTMLCDLLELES